MPRPTEKLQHELQVHQIELEMQNEQLRQSEVELEKSRDRYVDFYDFAPVGYLTLNHEGMIDEINLTGAALLKVARNKLPYHRFASFVATEDRDRWHHHFLSVLKHDDSLSCELALQRDNEPRFYAHLDCLRLKKDGKEPVVRIVLTDITERKQAETELRIAATAFESQDGIMVTDAHNVILRVNRAFTGITGYTAEEAVGQTPRLLSSGRHDAAFYAAMWKSLQSAGTWQGEIWNRRKNGDVFPERLTITAVKGGAGEVTHYVGMMHDITERKQREMESQKLLAIVDSTDDAIISKTLDGIIQSWNYGAEQIFGYKSAEVIGKQMLILIPPDRLDEEPEILSRISRGEKVDHFETVRQRKDGRLINISATMSPIFDSHGKVVGISKIARDITERKQVEEQIRALAFYDTLTQLPNRRLLNDRLEQTMAASKRSGRYGALMFLDMDNFKPLNDTHGHDVGDLLLVETAHRLTGCVREMDTVARFGGDEFMVMLGELDVDKAESATQAGIVAEKIRATLAEPYVLKLEHEAKTETETTVEHHCTSSIGVVLFIDHAASTEEIIKWADMAMYQAKEAGGNLIRFYDSTGE
ncbi:MAG: hypothetical protein A2Z65_06845 [Gallionellales bacterium RIFCSPLOWO2_02_58_13]|nr:MAG: hypothetical protein A2Z65_06845 [Gallionellales bacterium RIFCSPLOWO2_02_58_13]